MMDHNTRNAPTSSSNKSYRKMCGNSKHHSCHCAPMTDKNARAVVPPGYSPSIMVKLPNATAPDFHQPETKTPVAYKTDESSRRMANAMKYPTSTTQQAPSPPVLACETSEYAWRHPGGGISPSKPHLRTQDSESIYLPDGEVLNPKPAVSGNFDDKKESTVSVADNREAEFDARAPKTYMAKPHVSTTVSTPAAKVKKPKEGLKHAIEKGSVLTGAVGTEVKNTSGKKANRNRMGSMKLRDDDYNDSESKTRDLYAAMGEHCARGGAKTRWQEVKQSSS